MSQLRKIYYRLNVWNPFKPTLYPSKEEIDVVIPVVPKDLDILPLCIEGVRRCVAHPIKDIYLVAPNDDAILKFCSEYKTKFVDELTVLGFSPKDLDLKIGPDKALDRSGWLFQQLIKLSGKVGTCRRYLCIDSDHILVSPHVFLTDTGKTVFYMSYEKHEPYYKNIRRMFPDMTFANLSYVAHKMLFDKEILELLHHDIEQRMGNTWIKSILNNYDRNSFADFSEFELYGNYMPKDKKILRPWCQKLLRYNKLADYDTLQRRWSGSRMSLTFPAYRK